MPQESVEKPFRLISRGGAETQRTQRGIFMNINLNSDVKPISYIKTNAKREWYGLGHANQIFKITPSAGLLTIAGFNCIVKPSFCDIITWI